MEIQGRVLTQRCHALRLLTHAMQGEDPGLPGLLPKLFGCEVRYRIDELALDALGETGLLTGEDERARADGEWFERLSLDLGLIIGGGTAQIQKNIISERGLEMPREPKAAA